MLSPRSLPKFICIDLILLALKIWLVIKTLTKCLTQKTKQTNKKEKTAQML